MNRSIHYGTSGIKNTCRILFPELLDLTPFTTSGQLSTSPSAPISSPTVTPPPRSNTPTPATYAPRVLYRLSAVVCHYGAHSFGHYVAYRRKPRPASLGKHRFDPPTLRCPLGCECEKCAVLGPIRDEDVSGTKDLANGEMPAYAASRWLRISDDSVEEVGVERVLAETAGTFMLYYERVVQPRPTLWPVQSSPRSSEETIKPAGVKEEDIGFGSLVEALRPQAGARIVRSVYAGRSRSPSVRDLSPASSLLESMASSVHEESGPLTPTIESSTGLSTPTLNGDVVHPDAEAPSIPNVNPVGKTQPNIPHVVSSSRSPQHPHPRLASPQPAHALRPPSPARTVGLRA